MLIIDGYLISTTVLLLMWVSFTGFKTYENIKYRTSLVLKMKAEKKMLKEGYEAS